MVRGGVSIDPSIAFTNVHVFSGIEQVPQVTEAEPFSIDRFMAYCLTEGMKQEEIIRSIDRLIGLNMDVFSVWGVQPAKTNLLISPAAWAPRTIVL